MKVDWLAQTFPLNWHHSSPVLGPDRRKMFLASPTAACKCAAPLMNEQTLRWLSSISTSITDTNLMKHDSRMIIVFSSFKFCLVLMNINAIAWCVFTAWNGLCVIPDDVFSCHGWRLTLNIMFLLLLVLHRNAALKEYAAVTELSPGRLFHLLVLPAGRSWVPKFVPSMKTLFGHRYQRL